MGGMGGMGYGGYGSSMYGGMGGMGGYGSMYGGGMGGMYGGMGGMPQDPNSLTHGFTQSTQATFQIIESIVGAFGGFAQMLESTYMATHSSFFGESFNLGLKTTANNYSNGIRCRTVWQPEEHSWVNTGDIYHSSMATNVICQVDRTATTGRCNITDAERFCIF
jgi:hypothetical protein